MEHLFGPHYVQGYTVALMDVKNVMQYIRDDMKRHKMPMNQKNIDAILQCMIENRVTLREDPDAFVRCTQDKGFEVVSGTWRHPASTKAKGEIT